MFVFRLEFFQPAERRWTGPYCAEWMTPRAFEIREAMMVTHIEGDPERPWPDSAIFLANPGVDRYVCGTSTLLGLQSWFGRWLGPLLAEGGHVGTYEVPAEAVGVRDGQQIVYQQRRAVLLDRFGTPVDRDLLVHRIHATKGDPGE